MPASKVRLRGPTLALVAAVLFGASTPFAKLLLDQGVGPWLLAGLLYFGSGLGLGATYVVQPLRGGAAGEAPLRGRDLPWLALVVLTGGVAGPLLLMIGLTTTAASTGALLLNLEGLATMAIAWLVFRESVDRRLLLGAAAILAGAVLVSWQSGGDAGGGIGIGTLAIAGACLAWGIDNNLTRKLSAADPVAVTLVKGLAAGATNTALAFALGATLPSPATIVSAAALGFVSYGVSLVLFVLALRHLGTARSGAYFSTAPFIGAALAVPLLGESVTPALLAAAALMAVGVYLHLTEKHEHPHLHEEMQHEHRHVHDEHHRHAHAPDDPLGEPHSHVHRHETLRHRHAHYPDLHHRHSH